MTKLVSPLPGDIWIHTRSGKRYRILTVGLNAITNQREVIYEPLYFCQFSHFTRQLDGHPKAFLSLNGTGDQRFILEKEGP
jgi:hypothetical protein